MKCTITVETILKDKKKRIIQANFAISKLRVLHRNPLKEEYPTGEACPIEGHREMLRGVVCA